MTHEQITKLQEAIRLIREAIGESTQMTLIKDVAPTADMRGLRAGTLSLLKEAFVRYEYGWIDPKSIDFKSMMGRNGILDLSQFFKVLEQRGAIEVRRFDTGMRARYHKFRFIQKIPI